MGLIYRGFISIKKRTIAGLSQYAMDDQEKKHYLALFGDSLRKLRMQAGLSQEDLAEHAGVDRSYLGAIERGEHNVALLNIIKIANGLSLEPHRLLEVYSPTRDKN